MQAFDKVLIKKMINTLLRLVTCNSGFETGTEPVLIYVNVINERITSKI